MKNDGSYVDYDTVSEFLADFPQRRQEYLDFYLGGDIALEDVVCTFRIDEEGKLTANQFQINLKTIDSAGGYHTMQMARGMEPLPTLARPPWPPWMWGTGWNRPKDTFSLSLV